MTPAERKAALEAIAAEVTTCTRCPLHRERTRAVPGEGHPDTEVVFVGEGPGYNEDKQGRPFVGAAGNLLNELLGVIGWRRDEVFITNVVKCRPPGNRDPELAEIAACAPYLRRQLEVLDPALIVTLGRHSLQTFMPGERIGTAHGTLRPVDSGTGAANALAYAMYHPAAALRQGSLRETMTLDMAGVPDALLRARERRANRSQPAAATAPSVNVAEPGHESLPTAEPAEPAAQPAQPAEPAQPAQPAFEAAYVATSDPRPASVSASATDPDDQMELF